MMDEERGGPPKPIGAMASRALSKTRPSRDLIERRGAAHELARLDDQTLAQLRDIARAPLAPLEPICPDVLVQSLAALDAALPRRKTDEATGKLMLAAYRRKLGHMPKEQIDYLCNAVLERCDWFPTIRECLEIAGQWRRQDAVDQARARNLIANEMHLRMLAAHRRLKWGEGVTQEEVDSWPEGWREAAASAGLLHRDPARLYQIRVRPDPALPPPPATENDDGRRMD